MTTKDFYKHFSNAEQEEKEKIADYAYSLACDAFSGMKMSESALKVEGMEFFIHHIKEDLTLKQANNLLVKITGNEKYFLIE